jgi:hypothetical protein
MGLVFFFGALATGQILWGFGVLSFFGVAFCSLNFSAIDPSAKSPGAKKWFIAGMVFGVAGGGTLVLSAAIEIATGNTKSAIDLLIYLPLFVYLWRTQGREIKAILSKQSNSQEHHG